MNTDYLLQNAKIRELDLTNKLNSTNVSCDNVRRYASDQNTIYYPKTNQILYGVNKNMRALGVSDGTCNQINPQIFAQNNICGLGAAGGNPCVPDAYGIKNILKDDSGAFGKETFISNSNQYGYFITPYIVLIIIILLLIIILYINSNKELL